VPETPPFFPDPPQAALRGTHAHLAQMAGKAFKYPADVAPFGAIEAPTPDAFHDLHSLLQPGETLYLVDTPPPSDPAIAPGLAWNRTIPCLQLAYPPETPIFATPSGPEIAPLTCADAATMVALTDVAFPGLFRIRTCELGPYYGIRAGGQLVAMCGERMNIGNFRELSGLCTHPDHRGKGYAQQLMTQLMHDHRAAGLRSYLHVSSSNAHAIELYLRMGFVLRGEFPLYLATHIL